MKRDYSRKIKKVFDDLNSFKKKISVSHDPDVNMAIINYCLILAYGTIEDLAKAIIADYFSTPRFPKRCHNFANNLRGTGPKSNLDIRKEKFNDFFGQECSDAWLAELRRRISDTSYLDLKFRKYTYSEMFGSTGATDSLANKRNAFAHGNNTYAGSIETVIDHYAKCVAWLYEIDDIVVKIG